MAKARYRPWDRTLVPELEGRAEALAGTFNAQEVANMLWAYAKMGREPGAVMMRVLEGGRRVQELALQLVKNLLIVNNSPPQKKKPFKSGILLCISISISTCIYMHVCVHVCISYVCVCECMFVCACIYIRMYVY